MSKLKDLLILLTVVHIATCSTAFVVPHAQFKVFYPKGFEVSIPSEENITLFAFHGKLNEEMNGLETGKWARDIVTPRYDEFTFKEHDTSLKVGDIIYYWTYAVYNNLGYREDDGVFVVTHYTPKAGGSGSSVSITHLSPAPTLQPVTTKQSSVGGSSTECKQSITTTNKGQPICCAGEIIFEENFNGNKLDSSKWLLERRFTSQPDYEFVMYLLNDEVLKVNNGMATIKPIPLIRIYGDDILRKELSLGLNCTGVLDTEDCARSANTEDILPPFISSQFSTKGRFSFKYGKVEIRAKLPNAAWVFPQLFLEPVNSAYGSSDYQSGQMRVAFSRSNGGGLVNELHGGVILNADEPFRNVKMCKKTGPMFDWSADFHVYTLEWLPNKIVVSVDDVEFCSVEPSPGGFANMVARGQLLPNKEYLKRGTMMAPFDQEFYIKLGYGIGGRNDFSDVGSLWLKEKPWLNSHRKAMQQFWNKQKKNWRQWLTHSAEFQIDYVRVYSV